MVHAYRHVLKLVRHDIDAKSIDMISTLVGIEKYRYLSNGFDEASILSR